MVKSAGLWCLCPLLLASVLLSCDSELAPRTQVMLVVDSDLSIPSELNALDIEVVGPDGTAKTAHATLGAAGDLPQTLGLLHTQGALAPLTVRIDGLHDDLVVVSRRAELAFVPDQTRVLRIFLARSCVDAECVPLTCTDKGCAAPDVDPISLPVHDPHGELDAGVVVIEPDLERGWDASAESDATTASDAGLAMTPDAEAMDASSHDASVSLDSSASDAGAPDAGRCEVPPRCLRACQQIAGDASVDLCLCRAACDAAYAVADAGRDAAPTR